MIPLDLGVEAGAVEVRDTNIQRALRQRQTVPLSLLLDRPRDGIPVFEGDGSGFELFDQSIVEDALQGPPPSTSCSLALAITQSYMTKKKQKRTSSETHHLDSNDSLEHI